MSELPHVAKTEFLHRDQVPDVQGEQARLGQNHGATIELLCNILMLGNKAPRENLIIALLRKVA